MFNIRHKDNRGLTKTDWLHGLHSFSFGEYRDPRNMGFGPLRVINEDVVGAGGGFHTHGHANMEIITYVLEGALEHKDNIGAGGVIRPGDIQLMSAGKGVLHSEFNASQTDPVHLLQIWILPDETGTPATYQQRTLPPEALRNRLAVLAAPAAAGGSEGLSIRQDATVYASRLDEGVAVDVSLAGQRKYWLQLAKGAVTLGGQTLEAGDGLAVSQESGNFKIAASSDSEFIFFDLPQ